MSIKAKREWRIYFQGLGARIAQLRRQIGMTQLELARALGVSQQSVLAYERGDRRVIVPMLPTLAKILEVSTDELIGVTEPVPVRAPRVSTKIRRHAERLMRLSKTEQRFLVRIIDALEGQGGAGKN